MSTPPVIQQKPPTREETKQQTTYKDEDPVDARLRILRNEILPTVPYILSTNFSLHSEHIKSHYPQNEINWRKYTLFCRGEDELQYLTFKDRSDDHDIRGMFARGGWDDGKGKIAAREEPYSRTSSDGTPRQGQAATKKKISLADYKNRDKNRASQPALTATASSATAHRLKEGVKEGVQGIEKSVDNAAKIKVDANLQHTEQHGHRRSADTMAGTEESHGVANPPISPLSKKARTTPEPSTTSSKNRPVVKPQGPTAEATPSRAEVGVYNKPSHEATAAKIALRTSSITDQPSSKATQPPQPTISRIPPMLSPLSAEIEEELAKMSSAASDDRPGIAKSNTPLDTNAIKASKADRAITPTVNKTVKLNAAEKPANVTKLSKPATSTKGPQEQKQVMPLSGQAVKGTGLNDVSTPKPASNAAPNVNKGTPTATPKTTPDGPKRMRLRIVLRIKKKVSRKDLAAYLRMKPTPGRNSLFPGRAIEQGPVLAASASELKSSNDNHKDQLKIKGDSKSSRTESPKTGDKRTRAQQDEDDYQDEPPNKRKPIARIVQTQKPSTPKQPPTSSPAFSQMGSAQKTSTSTPKAEINGTAMLRAGSGQGSVRTPQVSSMSGTPSTGRRRRSYTSPEKPRSPKSEDLRAAGSSYMAIATHLKHDADLFLRKQEAMTKDDRKRGVLIGTESVLCFMTAFALMDTQRNYSDRNAWKSILPYLVMLQEAVKVDNLKHLYGLLLQLEGIIRDQIAYVDMQVLDKDPSKYDSGNPTADASKTKEQRKAEEYNKHCHEFHSNFMKAQNAWRSGWMLLDVIDVQAQYPKTWSKRDERRLAYGKGRDAVFKGKYSRKYNLPMGNMTSGLEAVNFGLNFIAEWSQAGGLKWKPKLALLDFDMNITN